MVTHRHLEHDKTKINMRTTRPAQQNEQEYGPPASIKGHCVGSTPSLAATLISQPAVKIVMMAKYRDGSVESSPT